jgi:hypothetical protein
LSADLIEKSNQLAGARVQVPISNTAKAEIEPGPALQAGFFAFVLKE